MKRIPSAARNKFTKLADFKPPDDSDSVEEVPEKRDASNYENIPKFDEKKELKEEKKEKKKEKKEKSSSTKVKLILGGFEYNIISGLCAASNGVLMKSAFSFGDDGPVLATLVPAFQSYFEGRKFEEEVYKGIT